MTTHDFSDLTPPDDLVDRWRQDFAGFQHAAGCGAGSKPLNNPPLSMRGPQPMTADHTPAAAVAVLLDAPVGRLVDEEETMKKRKQ